MTDVAPEIKAICDQLKQKDPYRGVSPEIYVLEMGRSVKFNELRICYWTVQNDKARAIYLGLYRNDRAPKNEEVLPFLQELFLDGNIHEVSIPGKNFREWFQGNDIYNDPKTYADIIADVITNQADARDEIELANDLMTIHKQDREN